MRGNSQICFSSTFIYCKLNMVTALNPPDRFISGVLCPSATQNFILLWLQTAFTHASVACTSPRLKHVAAACAPADATKTVTAAWRDEFSTRARS